MVQKGVLDSGGALSQKARFRFPVVYSLVKGMTSQLRLADLKALGIVEL